MPHIPPTSELLEHAQLRYRRKEYPKALELLDLAIRHEPSPTVTLLDTRAACHEKLLDHQSALRDARTCIRMFEKEPNGYLRAGKILQNMSKIDVALSIYKHGMNKKVKNVDLLAKMHDKLLRSLAPAKASDPFAHLPIEIVEMILSYLNFRQIVYCTRVSKQWHTFINSLPGLWMDLDFSQATKPVSSTFLTRCINTSRHKVISATLQRISSMEKVIRAISRTCREFKTLTIVDGGLRGESLAHDLKSATHLTQLTLGSSAPISSVLLPELLLACESLEDLDVRAVIISQMNLAWKGEFHKLKRLKLVSSQSVRDREVSLRMNALLDRTPNLESLVLNDWAWCEQLFVGKLQKLVELDLTSSVFSDRAVFACPALPQSLKILRYNVKPHRGNMISVPNPKDHFLPNLEELVCCGADIAAILLSDPAIKDAWPDPTINRYLRQPNLSKLHTLRVECTGRDETIPSILGLPRLERLHTLHLTNSSTINDEIVEHIASTIKTLEYIDLSSTMITGVGVRALVNKLKPTLKKMRLLNVWHCSTDVPGLVRDQGIRIEYSQNSQVNGKGKKVQYG